LPLLATLASMSDVAGAPHGSRRDPFAGAIVRFLAEHPGPHCAQCIGEALEVPENRVAMAILGAGSPGALTTLLGRCVRCGQRRTVVAAAA
jgi:hypothetical protein